MTDDINKLIPIADEIVRLCDQMSVAYRDIRHAPGFAESISIALYAKIYHSLRAIISDARQRRPEAIHHLKTMTECYIYVRWIHKDANEINRRAHIFHAKSCEEVIGFFKKNKDRYDFTEKHLPHWQEALRKTKELLAVDQETYECLIKRSLFSRIKEDEHLISVYQGIYSYACQPAHIGDIHSYLIGLDSGDFLGQPASADEWCYVAIDYAIQIALETLESIANDEIFKTSPNMGILTQIIQQLREQWESARK